MVIVNRTRLEYDEEFSVGERMKYEPEVTWVAGRTVRGWEARCIEQPHRLAIEAPSLEKLYRNISRYMVRNRPAPEGWALKVQGR